MTDDIDRSSRHKASKVAGFMFLFSFIVPTLNWALGFSKLIDTEDVMATAKNVIANDILFRIGITVEIVLSAGLVVLALSLYAILKKVNSHLALLALLLKVVEAGLVAAIVLISFIALQILNGAESLTAFTSEQTQTPLALLLNVHTVLYAIPMVFLGVDMMLFSYLFLKSKFIPRILAEFGILAFALILIHALMFILTPKYAAMPINQIVFWVPSGIFEIVIGIWLLYKGLRVQQA